MNGLQLLLVGNFLFFLLFKKKGFLIFFNIDNSDDYPNSIIEINMRILNEQLGTENSYKIIETIFSNFNLFPQLNQTKTEYNNHSRLFGIPISYQIANWTMNEINEDFVRFQIRVPEV